MENQVAKLNEVINLLDKPGVHVRLLDKNDIRERYSIRHNGDNAFERTDVAVTYGFVVVTNYGAKNQETDNAVISITKEDVKGEIENKIAELKIKLQMNTKVLVR